MPGDPDATAAGAGAFSVLPDALLGELFEALGPRSSWPLRSVCRRWRRAVEQTEWSELELGPRPLAQAVDVDDKAAAVARDLDSARLFDAAAALFAAGKLRLRRGAALALGVELRLPAPAPADRDADSDDGSDGDSGEDREPIPPTPAAAAAAAALRLLAAAAGGARVQPREVVVDLVASAGAGSYDAELAGRGRGGREPAAVAGAGPPAPDAAAAAAAGRELRAALAPFGGLRALSLLFPGPAGVDVASAVAAACPLLESLTLHPSGSPSSALAALAPLARLERLALVLEDDRCDVAGGLAALADGAAGASLRSLAFFGPWALLRFSGCGFPGRPGAPQPSRVRLSDAALRALGRMPKLERLEPIWIDGDRYPEEVSADHEPYRTLRRMASLREPFLHFAGGVYPARIARALRALAETINNLPRLDELRLRLHMSVVGASPRDVAAFLGSPGVRRALAALHLDAGRPLYEAEAAAVLALPALLCLRVKADLGPLPRDPASLRPYQILQGLPPRVAVSVAAVDAPRHTREAVAALFRGRPPAWAPHPRSRSRD
eukprot:tig00020904_g15154.t1